MIKKIILSALLVVFTCSISYAKERLAKYGETTTVEVAIYEVDGVNLRTDWAPAAADIEIMKDGGGETITVNVATAIGSTGIYSIILEATEMQAARIVLKFVDAATKVFLDTVIFIETYGNPSALHAFDLDTASVAQSADNDTKISTLITGVELNADAITAAKIADNAIAAEHIAADAIGASELAANAIGASEIATDAIGSSELATTAVDEIADGVWDEVLTAATHNVSTSAGKRIRELSGIVVRNETAQGSGTGNNQIQLDTGASAVDGAYDPSVICIVSGTGIGQSRLIFQYEGSTKTATVDRDWKTNPDATSEFVISCHPGREHVNEGLAQGGTSTSITLNTLASSSDNVYIGQLCFIRSGTGQDQSKLIIAYNGTTKVATINGTYDVTPDTTSGYAVLPISPVIIADTIQTSIDNIETDTGEIGTAGAGLTDLGGMSTTMKGQVNTEVDGALNTAIPGTPVSGSVNNALNNQNEIILEGAASGSHTTTTMQTDLTVTVNDQYNGRLITFTSDTATVALRNQQTDITDTVTTNSELTFTALTTAPSDGDKFVMN